MRGKEKDRKRERVRETKKEKGGEERDRTSEKRRMRKKERGRRGGQEETGKMIGKRPRRADSAFLRLFEIASFSRGATEKCFI